MAATVDGSPRKVNTSLPDDWPLMPPEGWMADYLRWACTRYPAPPEFHLAAILSWASFEAARRGWLFDYTHQRHPALWFGIIAKTGSGKGLALRALRTLTGEVEKALWDTFRDPHVEDYGDSPLIQMAGSPEGVLYLVETRLYEVEFAKARTCAHVSHDELQEILKRDQKHASFITDLIRCWDQTPKVERHQRNTQRRLDGARTGVILHPALSALFTSTAERLRGILTEEHLTGGFCNRLLWVRQYTDGDYEELNKYTRPHYDTDKTLYQLAWKCANWSFELARRKSSKTIFGPMPATETFEVYEKGLRTVRDLAEGSEIRRALVTRRTTHLQALGCVLALAQQHPPEHGEPLLTRPEHMELATKLMEVLFAPAALGLVGQTLEGAAPLQDEYGLGVITDSKWTGMTTMDVRQAFGIGTTKLRILLGGLDDSGDYVRMPVRVDGRGRPQQRIWHRLYAPREEQTEQAPDGTLFLTWDAYCEHIKHKGEPPLKRRGNVIPLPRNRELESRSEEPREER